MANSIPAEIQRRGGWENSIQGCSGCSGGVVLGKVRRQRAAEDGDRVGRERERERKGKMKVRCV